MYHFFNDEKSLWGLKLFSIYLCTSTPWHSKVEWVHHFELLWLYFYLLRVILEKLIHIRWNFSRCKLNRGIFFSLLVPLYLGSDISHKVFSCILVEHLSNLLYGLFGTTSSSKILKNYTSKMFPQVFEHVHYTTWRALPILYVNSVSTLIYSFSDQLIIMISLALGNYFELFNRKITSLRGKVSIDKNVEKISCILFFVVTYCL